MRNLLGILTLFFVSSLAAQPLTVGTHVPNESTTFSSVSWVNLSDSALASGTVDKASVYWNGACSSAFKVVFLRTAFGVSSFNVVATRGPFNAISGRNDVTLTPPVSLVRGDLIGVVQLQPFNTCGGVVGMYYSGNAGYTLTTSSDISTGALGTIANYRAGYRFSAVAYSSDPLLVRILPAAGAVQGASAFFRTAVQIQNASSTSITGSFVFHKAGQSASAGDPSLPFTLLPGRVVSYPDLIATMGTSGLGSLDVVTNGGAIPIVTARVFSDGGVAGTTGFSEEGVSPSDAIDVTREGFLFTPDDPTNFRMNIGVRTLDNGADIAIYLISSSGAILATRTTTYPANYFEQVSLATFTGASTIQAGGRIFINVNSGGIIVYSSIIDNRTSDSTFRLADVK